MTTIRRVTSGSHWESAIGYSRAVRVGPWVHVSGTAATSPDGGAVGGDNVEAQAEEVFRRIGHTLMEAGAALDDVVRTRIFLTDITDWEAVGRAHGRVFNIARPATTIVQVSKLVDPSLLVEVEADAYVSARDEEPDYGA